MKKGAEVRLKFFDHAHGTKRLVPCTVYGQVLKVTKKKVVVESWVCEGDAACQDANNERFVIVRAAIKKVKVFD